MDSEYDFVDKVLDRKNLRHRVGIKKVSQGVFDDSTLLTLYHLTKRKAFDEITGIVSQGKEANVYHGKSRQGEVAVKIYCVDACDFRRMRENIMGDPRFSVGKNRRRLVYQWAQRECKNLQLIEGQVSSPRPILIKNNVVVMEFIGQDGLSAAKIKDAELTDPEKYFESVIDQMKMMISCGIVHGDLSEYNILDSDGSPYFIDFSMGVTINHPQSRFLLERDVKNIVKFFEKHGVSADEGKILKKLQ